MPSFHLVRCVLVVIILSSCASIAVAASPTASKDLGDLSKVGQVSFPTSCDPSVQKEFERGLALLHSFFYPEARRIFTEIAEKDPECAMAHWGIAMTYYHPIWAPPDSADLAAGRAAVERALAASKQDDHEAAYIRAMQAFYTGLDEPILGAAPSAATCHALPTVDPKGRAMCFSREMEQVTSRYPKDLEAAAFFALSLLGTAPPGDPALTNPKRAAAILEALYATHPDHPGLVHYLIHSYDYPSLAAKGLKPANAYAAMQPWVPHALHMPSHIYTRLGMWPETIASNLASADAARKDAALNHPGAATHEELHALDYMLYAYLQTAQDGKAKDILKRVANVQKTYPESDFGVAYAIGAIPARYSLERRQWKDAAALQVRPMPFSSEMPFSDGLIVYAQAIGAAKSGDLPGAERAADRLLELSSSHDVRFRYFADQMKLQRQAALGLIALAQGRTEDGLRLLRDAAAREDSLGKHPVSPGSLLPIREILGEALLENGKPDQALVEYEASLHIYPARFNGVFGAAKSAERSNQKTKAQAYYRQLLDLAKNGDGARPEIAEARTYLAGS